MQLLEADPDLARGLEPRRAQELAQRLVVRTLDLPPGPWSPRRPAAGDSPPVGLLVLHGVLVREASVGEHGSAELLGPGDLVRPWEDDQDALLHPLVTWGTLGPVRLAVIDRGVPERVAPELAAPLVERASRRAERLAVLQALTSLTRVEDRLLAALWALAERWGRVVPAGVVVDLHVPHRTLAGMIGARRPSVTTALGHLLARGLVERRPAGGWVLLGEPPQAPGAFPARASTRFERRSVRAY